MPESSKPLVSALIVCRNAKEELLQCLKAFFASADVPVEAIVADNASSAGSPPPAPAEFPQSPVLVQSKDLGSGRAAPIALGRCRLRSALLFTPASGLT